MDQQRAWWKEKHKDWWDMGVKSAFAFLFPWKLCLIQRMYLKVRPLLHLRKKPWYMSCFLFKFSAYYWLPWLLPWAVFCWILRDLGGVKQAQSSQGNLPEHLGSPAAVGGVSSSWGCYASLTIFSSYFELVSMLSFSKYCLLPQAAQWEWIKSPVRLQHSGGGWLPITEHWDLDVSLWDCQDLSWDAERREPGNQTLILSLENPIMLSSSSIQAEKDFLKETK